jgi:hypothetical protein
MTQGASRRDLVHRTREIWEHNAAFNARLTMDGITEPAFPPGTNTRSLLGWPHLPSIPPVLAARFRPAR